MKSPDILQLNHFRFTEPPGSGCVINMAPMALKYFGYKVGDKIASEYGHGTLSEYPESECEACTVKLDSYDDETLAWIVSKTVYERQKEVAEKMIEIYHIQIPPEDTLEFNRYFGRQTFFSALLIERNREKFPKITSPEGIDAVCRAMPNILGRHKYEIRGVARNSEFSLKLNGLYKELLASVGAEEKEDEFMKSIILRDCQIWGTNGDGVIGGCDCCLGGADCQ